MTTRPIRWGIVGAGDIADRIMAPAMRAAAGAELVAVMRRDRGAAEAFAERHGALRAFDRVDDLLADPDVEAVYVASPNDAHLPNTLAAVAAGRDILCEKPLARTVPEADEMIRASEAAGVRLATCFYQRYNARHQEIRRLLAAGRIGQVTAVRINFSSWFPETPGAWRQDPARGGGGSFTDMGVHAVDLLRFLFGDVHEVTAFVATLAASHRVEDTASALLRLDGGIQALVTAHWSTFDSAESRSSVIEIGGTDGTIVSWPLHDKFSRGSLLVAAREGGGDPVESAIPVPERSTHVALLDDFAAARNAGRPFPISAHDGLAAQRVLEAVAASARTGRHVRP